MKTAPLRIWRSPYSHFYKDEILTASRIYTQDYLAELADHGFTAIWLRGILRDMLKSPVFPEFGSNSAEYLRNLRTVIRRGEKAGVQVYLYMQEPRGMPEDAAFWKKHPEAQGATYSYSGGSNRVQRESAMCASEPSVRDFMRLGAADLSRKLPALGGAVLITASEHVSHCYSHWNNLYAPEEMRKMPGEPLGCVRCEQRRPADVVADVVNAIRDGFAEAGNGARTIAWNWSWNIFEPDPQAEILKRLHSGVTIMAGFERGGRKIIMGKMRDVDEYALGYAGPSERFMNLLKESRKRGFGVMARLQYGTTHELATVPNLPLIGVLYDKAKAMRKLRVTDFMGCWNFGNMLTANTAALDRFLTAKRLPPRGRALTEFAAGYLPGCDAPQAAEAWTIFEKALGEYPFCIPYLYYGPSNYALIHPIEPAPLSKETVARAWMDDARGDDLRDSIGEFSVDEIIRSLGTVASLWRTGVEKLEAALAGCDAPQAAQELSSARAAYHCFRSARNLYRAYTLRKNWKPARMKALRPILEDELDNLKAALPIVEADPRLGFHSECQAYLFDAPRMRKKIRRIQKLITA